MTAREVLFGLTLLSVAINATAANPSLVMDTNSGSEIVSHEGNAKTDLPLVLEDNVFSSAYYDVLDILSARNRCSEFFGGAATIDIFNRMVAKMRKNYFSANIGIRMSGKTENIIDRQTNRVYRLFEKVSINANGPFYRGKSFNFDQSLPGVGTYKPATREVRVLMLLHELGHAVTTDDGKWLLPNDGNDEVLSRSNSMKIETMCGKEIADLGRVEGKTEVAASAADAKDH